MILFIAAASGADNLVTHGNLYTIYLYSDLSYSVESNFESRISSTIVAEITLSTVLELVLEGGMSLFHL